MDFSAYTTNLPELVGKFIDTEDSIYLSTTSKSRFDLYF